MKKGKEITNARAENRNYWNHEKYSSTLSRYTQCLKLESLGSHSVFPDWREKARAVYQSVLLPAYTYMPICLSANFKSVLSFFLFVNQTTNLSAFRFVYLSVSLIISPPSGRLSFRLAEFWNTGSTHLAILRIAKRQTIPCFSLDKAERKISFSRINREKFIFTAQKNTPLQEVNLAIYWSYKTKTISRDLHLAETLCFLFFLFLVAGIILRKSSDYHSG